MNLVKNMSLIVGALIIDGFQAFISAGIAVIAAFPGTIAGGAAGCAAGDAIAGQIGCWIGGSVLGLLGTTGNALLAPVTVPLGIVLGFAINMCLSLVGGALLLTAMWFFGVHISTKRLWWGGGEIIPGINNIPFWTTFVVMSALDGNAPQNSLFSTVFSGIQGARSDTVELAAESKAFASPMMPAYLKRQQVQEQGDGLQRAGNQADNQDEAVRANRTRQNLQDIRSTKPHVQPV